MSTIVQVMHTPDLISGPYQVHVMRFIPEECAFRITSTVSCVQYPRRAISIGRELVDSHNADGLMFSPPEHFKEDVPAFECGVLDKIVYALNLALANEKTPEMHRILADAVTAVSGAPTAEELAFRDSCVEQARRLYDDEDCIQIDSNASLTPSPEGTWVQAWLLLEATHLKDEFPDSE